MKLNSQHIKKKNLLNTIRNKLQNEFPQFVIIKINNYEYGNSYESLAVYWKSIYYLDNNFAININDTNWKNEIEILEKLNYIPLYASIELTNIYINILNCVRKSFTYRKIFKQFKWAI